MLGLAKLRRSTKRQLRTIRIAHEADVKPGFGDWITPRQSNRGTFSALIDFYFPTELGEQLAFAAALLSALLGLFMLLAPGITNRFLGLRPREGRIGVYAEARSQGGLYLGLGAMALVLAQPLVYLALGSAFAAAAFGRLLSILLDRAATLQNAMLLILQIALAALPMLYALGYV